MIDFGSLDLLSACNHKPKLYDHRVRAQGKRTSLICNLDQTLSARGSYTTTDNVRIDARRRNYNQPN